MVRRKLNCRSEDPDSSSSVSYMYSSHTTPRSLSLQLRVVSCAGKGPLHDIGPNRPNQRRNDECPRDVQLRKTLSAHITNWK